MTSASFLPRKLVIFGIVLPLAVFAGYLLSNPDAESLVVLGIFAAVLCMPLFLRWHHPVLIVSWNLSMSLYFLPGNPPLWMLAAGISLGVTLLSRILDKHHRLLGEKQVTLSLLALVAVVFFTMAMNGGLGLRSLGASSYGGRKYFFILAAVVAYFALSMQPIPLGRANTYIGTFFLAGVTPVVSHIIYLLGPSMWVLYGFFQVDWAVAQALEDFGMIGELRMGRLPGLGPTGLAIVSFLLFRYGVRGVLDWTKPWRGVIFMAATGISLFGGFRSIFAMVAAVFVFQAYFEGLHKTRWLPAIVLGSGLLLMVLVPFANRLPLSAQRCLTIIPFANVDPIIRVDAMASTDWRLRMWSVLLPEVPKYLWVGRGCATDATEFWLASESMRRGFAKDFDMALISGDYHSGPISVILPFGLVGVVAFGWFLYAGGRVLWRNYRYGAPELRRTNTFLLSLFVAKVLFFLCLFGALHSDLIVFVGLVGLSVSLNRGMCEAPAPTADLVRARSPGPLILRPFRT